MKKFLSYVLTFISLFVISTVVTIQSQSDVLNNQPSSSAGASSPTTLLAGIMESIENNPKLDINGEISIDYEGDSFDIDIDADIDLTTLTNPSIMASVGLTLYGNTYQILATYAKDEIFLSCGDVAMQSKISDISDIASMIGSLIGQPMAMPSLDLSSISLDSIIGALNNPQKTEIDNTTFYTITLPQIAKVTIGCDDKFNIQSIVIDEVYLIENLDIKCGIKVSQDNNINITAPKDSGQYLDVAGLINNLVSLKDKNIKLSAITNIYKEQNLFERVESMGFVQMSQNKYQLKNNISGWLDGKLNINYIDDVIYAKYNDIGVSLTGDDIDYIKNILDNSQVGDAVANAASVVDELVEWLQNNYNDILQNATIASNQIALTLPTKGMLNQSQDIKIVLKLKDQQIEAVSLSGISVGDYTIYSTIYVREFDNYEIAVNSNEYFNFSTGVEIVDWVKNIHTLEMDAQLHANIGGELADLAIQAKIDTLNNNQQISTNLFDMPISITHLNGEIYVGINDIFVKLDAQNLFEIVSQYIPQQEINELFDEVARVANNLTINDILGLINISTTSNSIDVSTNLSMFVGKTLTIDINVSFDQGFVLEIENLTYDNISLTGNVSVANTDNAIEVDEASKYLSIEDTLDDIDEFISSQTYTIDGKIDFSGYGIGQAFDGLISVDLENLNLQISGQLSGKLNADIDLIYTNNTFYIQYNNQKFALSETKLMQLLDEFDIDLQPALDKLTQLIQAKNNFSLKTYLSSLLNNSQSTLETQNADALLQEISLDDILDIIKNITINNSTISAKLSALGYDIDGEIQLNQICGVDLIVDGDILLDANLLISTEPSQYNVNGDYVNLNSVVSKIIATKNTLSYKDFSGKLYINLENGAKSYTINYQLSIENGISASFSTTIGGVNIEIIFVDNQIYAKVENICVTITAQQLTQIVSSLFGDEIAEASAQLQQALDISVDDILEIVYNLTSGDAILSDVHDSGITTYITIMDTLQLAISGVDNLMYLGVTYNDIKVSASICCGDKQAINKPQGYLNIVDFATKLDGWVNSSVYAVSGEFDFSGFGIDEKFVGEIAIDFANLAITIDGTLSGKLNADIELKYINERVYISYNKQHFTISETKLVSLLNEFGIDISNVLAQVKEIANIKNNFSLTSLVNSLLGISTLDTENAETLENVNLDQVVEIVKNITVTSSNIGFAYNFGTLAIDANIELGESLGVTFALAMQDIAVGADITLAKTYTFEDINNHNYINLDLIVPRIPQILELLDKNNFVGNIVLSDGEQSLDISYALYLDINAKQFELTLSTTIKGLDLEIYVSNEEIYLRLENIYLNISIEQIFAIATSLFGTEIDEIMAKLAEAKNMSVDEILAKVEEITSSSELITELKDVDNTTYLTILDKLTISMAQTDKMLVGLSYNGISVNVGISATTGDSIVTRPNAETYLNVVDFVTKLDGWVNSSVYAVSGEFDFSGFGIDEKFVGEIAIDFANLAITIDGALSGKLNADIELKYINERVYISYNKQHFTISEAELVNLLNEFGIDISNILAQVKEIANIKNDFSLTSLVNSLLGISTLDEENAETLENVNIDQIIEIISKINLNSQSFAFNSNILGYNINLNLSFGAKIDTNIEISNEKMAISVNVDIKKQVEQDAFAAAGEYYNLDNISTILSAILNTIQDTQFGGTLSLSFGTSEFEKVDVNYDINIVEGKINAELVITYLGQTATIYVIDNQLFVGVKGVFIKATFEQIIDILQAELPADIKQKIDDAKEQLSQSTNDIFKTVEDITNSEFIDNLEITPNKLIISICGISAEISVNNDKLSIAIVSYNGISANISLSSSQNSQAIEVDADAYIDIDNVYNLVKNVYNYAIAGEYYYDINLSAFGYNVTGYVGYNQGLVAHLQTTILNKTLIVDISNETIYVNFDGLVAHIAFEKIPALLGELNAQFDLNIPQNVLDIVDKLLVTKDFGLEDIENIASGTEPINWQTLLEEIAINLYSDKLTVGYNIFDAEISLVNNMISQLLINVSLDEQTLSATIKLCDKQTFATPEAGLDVADITGLLKYISKLVKTTNYVGEFSFDYKDISLEGQYGLEIRDNQISARISTTFYDLPISVVVVNNIVYAQIDNVKIYLPLSQINDLMEWINTSFNQTLPTDLDISTSIDNSGDISLDSITFGDIILSIVGNVLSASYQDVSAAISIADVSNIALTYKDISASLTIDTTTEQIVAPQGYLPYTDFTDIVDSLLDLYSSGKISATAQGFVYEGEDLHYTADCALQIDINAKQIFISVAVCDLFENSNIDIMIAYRDNYWFVDYNNLKLKISSTDLKEILAILLEVVGIDPSLLPFLSDVVGGLDVNTDSLSALVPELDFGNPLTLIDVFEKISLKQGELSVEVDNSLIAGNLNSENIFAVLKTQNNKLSYIALNNLYTGTTDYEKLDFTLSLKDFEQVSEPYQGNYIDLSGANELIKAIINTAELDYFEITATIDVDMSILPRPMHIPMDVRIRLDENRKPEIMISLGDIPVMDLGIKNINNDIGVIPKSRMWYIYYKDSYIYMLRHDEASKKVYQKELKVHVDSFFDDFFYYLQWGVGFDDWIIDEIEKALALTDGYTPDLGKVINGFTVTDSQNFSIDINMEEVANNPQIENMIINLGVVNNEQTNNKNYIGTAEFCLNMPVMSIMTIKLVSEDMQLINIGQPFDFTDFEKFVYNYVGIEGTEYNREWNVSNGTAWDYAGAEWQLASEREYTITFDSQGGEAVSAITGKTNQEITLPTLANKVVVDVEAGIRYTYTFGGWYQTELCKNGTEFASTTMPKKNMTLYAKWVLDHTEQVVSITFDSNGGTAFDSISGYAGTQVDISGYVPTKADSYVYKDSEGAWWWKKYIYDKTTYTFDGWYIDSACTTKFDGILPDVNTTLYAKWIETTTEVKLDSKV